MRIVLGLGGNLGDVSAAFAVTLAALCGEFGNVRASSLWSSAPIGPPQRDFLNAAVLLGIDVHPLRLLAFTRSLEAAAGRDRTSEAHWGPRVLDIDLLLAEDIVIEGPELTLPHPRLHERQFALLPAAELAADWIHPRLQRSLAELATAIAPTTQPCRRLGSLPGIQD